MNIKQNLSLLNVFLIMSLIAGSYAVISIGYSYAQNTTDGISPTVNTYDTTFESITALAIAIISIIGTILVRRGANQKYVDGVNNAKDIVQMLRHDRETRREGMQLIYDLFPERVQGELGKPLVKLDNLNKDIAIAEEKLTRLNLLIDKFQK